MELTRKAPWIGAALGIAFSFASPPAFSGARETVQLDPIVFNSYQWNRKNAVVHNGQVDRGDWYEWWYYKVLPQNSDEAFYFVYGIVNPWDTSQTKPASRAWTGFGSFSHKRIIEQNLSPSEFFASYESPVVVVGKNAATERSLVGEVSNAKGSSARWDLSMEPDWSFNAMGWTLFAEKLLNIYWFPAQASAKMTGWVEVDGRRYAFDRAPAYQDRNWGSSFPKWWAWLVANNFKDSPGTVLAAGGGRPRIMNRFEPVEGMTIGFRHKGKVYTFRPGDGDLVRTKISFGSWEVRARNKRLQQISISASAPREKFMRLPFMTPQGKEYSDYEALRGHIRVTLKTLKETVEVTTDEGGIEYGSFNEFSESIEDTHGNALGLEP